MYRKDCYPMPQGPNLVATLFGPPSGYDEVRLMDDGGMMAVDRHKLGMMNVDRHRLLLAATR